MTLEGLKAEIKVGVDFAGVWNWNYDEAMALIARVEEVVKEMRVLEKQALHDPEWDELFGPLADKLEGKDG